MPYCVHCGAAVTDAGVPCPACGQAPLPAAQSPPGSSAQPRARMPKSAIVAIIAAVGCLPAIAIAGIIAALIIPNFVDALNKAKQKRTVADLLEIEAALGMHASGQPEGAPLYPDVTEIHELAAALAPYGEIAQVDGWQRPFRYSCARAAVGVGCDEYRIASAGRDGAFEHEDPWHYEPGTPAPGDFDADIVTGSNGFVRGPGP